jgi:hypothetical protein
MPNETVNVTMGARELRELQQAKAALCRIAGYVLSDLPQTPEGQLDTEAICDAVLNAVRGR